MTAPTSDPPSDPPTEPVVVPPDPSTALDRLSATGIALLQAGRADEAVEVLLHAVAAAEPGADDLLARAYLDGGDWYAAADYLGRLVEHGHVRFAGRLGVALAEIGDVGRAEAAFRLALDHGELAACNDLAILLTREGRFTEAVPLLQRAADAGDPQAAANLVELLYESGDLRAATLVAERYAAENRPDTLVALADVRAAAGRVDEAEHFYRRAAVLGAVRAHGAYATFLATELGDPQAAEREFREAVRLDEPGCAFALGRFLVDEGRPAEARPYLVAAAALGDEEAVTLLAEVDGEDPFDD
jgi:tetratricopeptide (TPR) repeat protein